MARFLMSLALVLIVVPGTVALARWATNVDNAHEAQIAHTAVCKDHGGQWVNNGCYKLEPVK